MSMSAECEMLLLLLLKKQKKRRRNRASHVHPLLADRLFKGLHHTLFDDLRQDDRKFFQYFRMSKGSFDELFENIKDMITKIDTKMRNAIPADEKLALTLRYLGSGATMQDLHMQYRIGHSTISQIIREVCNSIWTRMKSKCFPEFTADLWLNISSEFMARTNFPHVLGAIDGKHIRIIKPTDTGSLNFNYKKFFSFILLAICDANYKFIFVDVGAYGKSADSTVLKNSVFFRKLLRREMNIPEPRDLGIGFKEKIPFMFVADEGFGQSEFILRPYGGKFLNIEKRIFNYRLTRARRYIECTFGILANKWRIFHRPLNVNSDLANLIIKTCCLLHNFVRDRDGIKFEDSLIVEGFTAMARNPIPSRSLPNNIRKKFSEYFLSPEGQLPWQFQKIGYQ